MIEVLRASLAEQAAPVRGLRVLLFGFSGSGFPGGDGADEAVRELPRAGVHCVRTHEADPEMGAKLAEKYDVSIVCNTRVAAVAKADTRAWICAREPVYWHWDLRPGSVGAPLRGRPKHVALSFNGPWTTPQGATFSPEQWAAELGVPVHYAPQGAPLREPGRLEDAPRIAFVGDVKNGTYHQGRRAMCEALGAKVLNSRQRPGRLAIEAQMPALYPSARYCLSMSPLAPGYTSVRTYSILACGGLLLLHRFPGADRLFGENAVLFDTAEEAKARTAELDEHPERRQRIADAGRRRHAERHTVSHRVLSICRQVTGVDAEFNGWHS